VPPPRRTSAPRWPRSRQEPASGSQSLIDGPDGYPVINYEYAIVKVKQASADEAAAVRVFPGWGISAGSNSKYLKPMNFEPLPSNVLTIARHLIAKIH
jgi:phosphate transport system substrate-binding protein